MKQDMGGVKSSSLVFLELGNLRQIRQCQPDLSPAVLPGVRTCSGAQPLGCKICSLPSWLLLLCIYSATSNFFFLVSGNHKLAKS